MRGLNGGAAYNNKIALWGYQVEEGAFATSYIRTGNSDYGRTATRGIDFLQIQGQAFTDLYNPVESTILCSYQHTKEVGSINADLPVMMPILLPNYLPRSARNRDFAIGYDTFQIVLLKYGIDNLKGVSYKGLTGEISFSGRKVLRKPYVFKITEEGYDIL